MGDGAKHSQDCPAVTQELCRGGRFGKTVAVLVGAVGDALGSETLDPAGPVPPHVEVWRSVHFGSDTTASKSRHTLAFSGCVGTVLRKHRADQDEARRRAGARWKEHDLVLPSQVGSMQDAHNVLRMFRDVLKLVPASIRKSGSRTSCGTRSCRSSRITGCRLRRSPA